MQDQVSTSAQTYLVRSARLEAGDITAVTKLLNDCAVAEYGQPDSDEAMVRSSWEGPGFDLARNTRLAWADDDKLVAYSEFHDDQENHAQFELEVYLAPGWPDTQVAQALMRLAEERVEQEMSGAAPNAEIFLQEVIWSKDEINKKLLEADGYRLVRHFWRMQIDITELPPTPQWPAGITVRTFQAGQDEETVWRTRQEAFADMWGFTPLTLEEYLHQNIKSEPHFDPGLWFLAFDGNEPAGICVCYPSTVENPDQGYVRSLAVRRPWRKHGLGMALLQNAFGEFYRRGILKAGLGVDAESLTGATRLYQRAGMRVVRQADFYRKTLRPSKGQVGS